jgi:hypothetical protein
LNAKRDQLNQVERAVQYEQSIDRQTGRSQRDRLRDETDMVEAEERDLTIKSDAMQELEVFTLGVLN